MQIINKEVIFREEERERAKLCTEDNIAMTPYSSLAGGRLSKHPEKINYLEEPYVPHKLVDVMAQNTAAASGKSHVWSAGEQKI